MDTKKKELLGDFFRPGRAYTNGVLHVQDHDFVTSEQRLAPYGVFDTAHNEAFPVAGPRSRYQRTGLPRCDLAVVAKIGSPPLLACLGLVGAL